MSNFAFYVLILTAVTAVLAIVLIKRRSSAETQATLTEHVEIIDSTSSDLRDELESNIAWLPDAVLLLDEKLNIVWSNQTAEEWLGTDSERDSGKYAPYVFGSEKLTEFLESRDYRESMDCEAPANKGKVIRVRIVPFRSGQLLLQARDVTQVKALEAVRRDFVANASH